MDIEAVRAQFPMLQRTVHRDGRELPFTYLDSAATALKPQVVIDAVSDYYCNYGVSVHRGSYEASQIATERFEAVRGQLQRYFGADERYVVALTHGATESLNIVAHAWARRGLRRGDEILITELEHHANIVPWQRVRDAVRCELRYLPINREQGGVLEVTQIEQHFNAKTRILAITGLSNVTGWHAPLKQIIAAAHRHNIVVVVDGAQLAAHERVNIGDLDCDFFACSGHKMCAPTGVGVLIGKRELLANSDIFIGGGNMITEVYMNSSVFKEAPERFEAGTPPIAAVIGFGAALEMLAGWDFGQLAAHERALTEYARRELAAIPQVELYGGGAPSGSGGGVAASDGASGGVGARGGGTTGAAAGGEYRGVVAFNIRGAHNHDIGSILDQEGVAVRAGHHCAQPYHRALHQPGSVRASFHLYNTMTDVEALIRGVQRAAKLFARD